MRLTQRTTVNKTSIGIINYIILNTFSLPFMIEVVLKSDSSKLILLIRFLKCFY